METLAGEKRASEYHLDQSQKPRLHMTIGLEQSGMSRFKTVLVCLYYLCVV